MTCEFHLTRRVEFCETDMAGIMHFSNFFRFMEAAEGAFIRSLGFSVVLSKSGIAVGLPRVHAECDYHAPLCYEDEVLVHLLVARKTTRSLSYLFRFYRLDGAGPRPAAVGRVTVVPVARQEDGSLKAVALPAALADRIEVAPGDRLDSGLTPQELQALAATGPHPLVPTPC